MATTTSKKPDAKSEAKAADEAHDKAYHGNEPLETHAPADPALRQRPDGPATAEQANARRLKQPAPEHVEAEGKSDTVHPLPSRVKALKDHNERRKENGEDVSPVGPGNAEGMTDRGAPAGDHPKVNPGTFLHPQTKEQVEATKRYSEPHETDPEGVWVTSGSDNVFVKGAVKGRPESDGSLSLLAGPLDPTITPKVVKKFRAGEWSYWGRVKQP